MDMEEPIENPKPENILPIVEEANPMKKIDSNPWVTYKTYLEEFTVKLKEEICIFGDVVHDKKSKWMLIGFPL